jgi:hypothetical protein
MTMLQGLETIVIELRAERRQLVDNLRHVDASLAVPGKLEGASLPPITSLGVRVCSPENRSGAESTLDESSGQVANCNQRPIECPCPEANPSAAARRKMALAHPARWAKIKAELAKEPA